MTKPVHLVVAPHPDDETLGCGGTLLRARHEGEQIHWVIVTEMSVESGFSPEQITTRQAEIERVAADMGFDSFESLGFPPAGLTDAHLGDLVARLGQVVEKRRPNILYLPFHDDVHSDHRVVFDAGMSCSKWFRHPSVLTTLCYEVLSETDMNIRPTSAGFRPHRFVNISDFLERKQAVLRHYSSEFGEFPFPRSVEAVAAQAAMRGASSGFKAAEAFMVLRERL